MTSFNDQIDALLTDLESATSDELETALGKYDTRDLLAVVAKRVLSGGGSGGSSSVIAIVKRTTSITDWDGDTLPFDAVVLDADGLWDAANHQFTAKTAGWYSVSTFGISTPAAILVPVGSTGSISLDAVVFGAGDNLHSTVTRSEDITHGGYRYPQINGYTHLDIDDSIVIQGTGGTGYVVPAAFCFAIELALAT